MRTLSTSGGRVAVVASLELDPVVVDATFAAVELLDEGGADDVDAARGEPEAPQALRTATAAAARRRVALDPTASLLGPRMGSPLRSAGTRGN